MGDFYQQKVIPRAQNIITLQRAALILGVNRKVVNAFIREKRINVVRGGMYTFVTRSSVEAVRDRLERRRKIKTRAKGSAEVS